MNISEYKTLLVLDETDNKNCIRCGRSGLIIHPKSIICSYCGWSAQSDYITGEWHCTEDYQKLGKEYFDDINNFGMR